MEPKFMSKVLEIKDKTRVKVRFNDTDAMGIVHFKNYLVYFDDGFVSFMNHLLAPKRIEDTVQEGYVFGVKKVDITYQGSVGFGDFVIVETQITEIGNSSVTFHHEIFRESDNKLIAAINCVRLVMELRTNKLIKVNDFFIKYL
ncbi:MAG: acyl-CoA thioesterase [Candidatus Odinarchaeota archaeon]